MSVKFPWLSSEATLSILVLVSFQSSSMLVKSLSLDKLNMSYRKCKKLLEDAMCSFLGYI